MDEEEIKILNKLYDEKHIVYSPEKIIVTRKFYNYIQDILATGYVEEFIFKYIIKSIKKQGLI